MESLNDAIARMGLIAPEGLPGLARRAFATGPTSGYVPACLRRTIRRMPMNFLDFEQPIAELEAKIDELKFVSNDAEVNIGEEIARLRAKSRSLTTSIFSNLTQWQIAQ